MTSQRANTKTKARATTPAKALSKKRSIVAKKNSQVAPLDDRHPFLSALGERVRALRAKRGVTRKTLSEQSGISERHLANLELGVGNVSILILLQIGDSLDCSLAELLGDVTTSSPEWLFIRRQLAGRDEATLMRARNAIADVLGIAHDAAAKSQRIALIGLRGAGKSTYGRALAKEFGWPFVELSREIEAIAGCGVAEIHALYGVAAYSRYERQALESTIQKHERAVIATPGGIVADTENFERLLSRCHTVWLQASPEEHMSRVVAQGDMRPIAASKQAMDDLRRILRARTDFYGKADITYETSDRPIKSGVKELSQKLKSIIL
jgi:XRE family transcriptional regulator, aerobic/anaerobic benzoate catabolism transcriptional regulator